MNSLDMPNTLSMYDTLSSGFVFVNLGSVRSVQRSARSARAGRGGGGLTTSNLCSEARAPSRERDNLVIVQPVSWSTAMEAK